MVLERSSRSVCVCMFHTKGQLKASIHQHLVWGRVGGAADLTFSHQDLRVQRHPVSWALLRQQKREKDETTDNEEKRQEKGGHLVKRTKPFLQQLLHLGSHLPW